jgi:hypothetical protein
MKAFKIILVFLIVAVYLNIGWGIGTHYYQNVAYISNPEGFINKFLAGGWNVFNHPESSKNASLFFIQICYTTAWPIIIGAMALSWIAYGLWQLIVILWSGIVLLGKLIFAGGLIELIGPLGMGITVWLLIGLICQYYMAKHDKIVAGNDYSAHMTLDENGHQGIFDLLFVMILAPLALDNGIKAWRKLREYKKKQQKS